MKVALAAVMVGLFSVTAVAQSQAQTAATPPLLTCGQAGSAADDASAKPARATLALDGQSDELVTEASFKRSTGTKLMTLVYNVTGCELGGSQPEPLQPPRIYPAKTGDTIPAGVIVFDGSPDIEGTRYIVHLKVSSDSFDPGSYTGLVEIKAPWLNAVRTPVSISRSENNVLVPLGWGALGALGGFGLFALLRLFKNNDLLVSRVQLALAFAVSIVVGAIAAFATNYLNQDVWSSAANAWATIGVGFTASTSGVMTALLAAVWSAEPPAGGGGGNGGDGDGPPTPTPTPT